MSWVPLNCSRWSICTASSHLEVPREHKILYFGQKISTFDYFYGGNQVKMEVHNRAKEKNAHVGGLDRKERLK
jgi:hypothetical protein